MNTQLRLIDPSEVSWRLDEHTKRVGRAGIARARAALAAARIPVAEDTRSPRVDHAVAA